MEKSGIHHFSGNKSPGKYTVYTVCGRWMAGNGKTLEHVCFLLKYDRMFQRDHKMLILNCRIK